MHHPLLFLETHCTDTVATYVDIYQPDGHPSVTVMEMHLPASRWDDGAFIDTERRRMLRTVLAGELRGRFENPILWINDPMAVKSFVGHLGERIVVYDCMDELSQFKGAPAGLIERERELVRAADVIFCGGRKMRDKRLPANPNCHFYGTGVDCDHFGKARGPELAVHPEMAVLDGPVLGYFGVIDERIDYELLARLADANPSWTVAMIGPFAKVNPDDLPQRENIKWLGAQPYADLPALTKGMDVCLMPFALNEATEYINPTKALEYMAAGKPVVSTALDEVVSNFGKVCRIGHSHAEFIDYCVKEIAASSESKIKAGLKLASENTWEAIASKMEGHIKDALHGSVLRGHTTATKVSETSAA